MKLRAFLFVLLLSVINSTAARGVDIKKEVVYKWAEYPPLYGNLYNHLQRNFKYPKEAWKAERITSTMAEMTIHTDGSADSIVLPKKYHPALEAELLRVLEMINWRPARNAYGEPVAVRFKLDFSLTCDPILSIIGKVAPTYIPMGLQYIVKDADKAVRKFESKPNELTETDISKLSEACDLFPENAASSMAYANMLAGAGNHAAAAEAMNRCLVAYHDLYMNVDSIRAIYGPDGVIRRPGYSGRQEVAVALHRALHRIPVNEQSADTALNATLSLIDKRIIDGDVKGDPTEQDLHRAHRRMEQLQRTMIQSLSNNKLSPGTDTPTWTKVTRDYSINELASSLSYWTEKGYTFNAEITGLHEEIKKEQAKMINGKKVGGDRVKLFGAKAFIAYLRGGEKGMSDFINQVCNGEASKNVVKYLGALEKKFKQNAALLADKDRVVQAMTYSNPEDNEAKQIRKAADETFSLNWLYKL